MELPNLPEAVAEEVTDILLKNFTVDPNVTAKDPVVLQITTYATGCYRSHDISTRLKIPKTSTTTTEVISFRKNNF